MSNVALLALLVVAVVVVPPLIWLVGTYVVEYLYRVAYSAWHRLLPDSNTSLVWAPRRRQ